ncbi:phosphatidylcholine synthase [Arcanobacterium hippocoleae]
MANDEMTNQCSTKTNPVKRYSKLSIIKAWGVHAFTLSGLFFACLAVLAMGDGEFKWMWLWLGIAMIVDAVDGTMARKACVQEVVPWFDGGIVDIAVDYLTWTFIPAVFMYLALPLGPKPVAMVMMITVVVSSMFCYANKNWKSTDYYFVGFPAAWNIVAAILWVLKFNAVVNVSVVIVLAILTLVPTYYTHPFRVKKYMAINIAAVIAWIISMGTMIAIFPNTSLPAAIVFWVTGIWFMATGVIRTIANRPDKESAAN